MQITMDQAQLEEVFTGDWEVKFVYDTYTVTTGVIALNGNEAIYHAEERLPLDILQREPEEIIVKLMGVYGGY